MEKTYFCVMSEHYKDGTVKAGLISRWCKEKPKDAHCSKPLGDFYNTWYDTYLEAEARAIEIRRRVEVKVKQKGELIKVGYRIPEALKKALEEKAKVERRSVNDQVIYLLDKGLNQHE